jgi:two-component system, OmpR family, sensor kinase
LLKSFSLFFVSQAILVGALFFINYETRLRALDESLFSKMRVCSFNLKCDEFKMDFIDKEDHELYKLHKEQNALSSYFSIPNSEKFVLKIYLAQNEYEKQIQELQQGLLAMFFVVLFVVGVLSFLFSIYALYPFRKALRLTEEFVKDILHDFNTPLSTLRLNAGMLKEEIGESPKIARIEKSVRNILDLQANLRAYLHSHASQKTPFELKNLLRERVALIEGNYKDVSFLVNVKNANLNANKDAFTRIIDNLLSNAAKYNKKGGTVTLTFEDGVLKIQDTGKGIQYPKKVFDRFYKEQDRGLGIGLHIVSKLCEELGVEIGVESALGEGTLFTLDLRKLYD